MSRNIDMSFGVMTIMAILFLISLLFNNNEIIQWLIVALFFYGLIYYMRDVTRNISIILFLVAFFTFLLGRVIMPLFLDESYFVDLFYSFLTFTQSTYHHIYVCLFLTLFFLFIGYNYFNNNLSYNIPVNFTTKSFKNRIIRKCSKLLVLCTCPFMALLILDKIRFVINHGYAQIFMEYESTLPPIFIVFTAIFEYMVYLFLSTLPQKKEALPILILYGIISIANMVAGDRGEAMMAVFVIIFYFYLRNRIEPGESEWIGKKGTRIIVAAVPFVISVLFIVSYLRDDESTEIEANNIGLIIGSFFYQQGASVNVIGCAFQDEHMLPSNKYYSLGAITDYFRNNHISRLLLGTNPYSVGSVELATKGNSLDSAITYIEDQHFYFSGGGMGSSFIAEAWHDFGYMGVILFALFYGYILAKIPLWCGKNVWIAVISLVFMKFILYAPRGRATAFLTSALSVSFWPIAFIIYLYAKNRMKKLCLKQS